MDPIAPTSAPAPDPSLAVLLDALQAVAPLGVWLGAAVLLAASLGALLAWLAARRGPGLDAFQAMAAEALQRNNEGFLTLAAERLRAQQEASAVDLDGRHKAIEDLLDPLHDVMARFQEESRGIERTRLAEAGKVGEQLQQLARQTQELSRALQSPGARGQWGELSLRRTVELAGLSAHCDFAEQARVGGARGGREALRPDLVVRLPSGRELAVDAKVPLDAYAQASAAGSEEERAGAVQRHARQLKRHVETLASRGYAAALERSPEFVVLFLPHDGLLAVAVESDRNLVSDALARGIVLATPATLYALLAAVAQGWREQALAENARKILAVAGEFDDRLATLREHLVKLGNALTRSVDGFNATVGSFETRVLVQARRVRELGVTGSRSLDTPEAIDVAVRRLDSPSA